MNEWKTLKLMFSTIVASQSLNVTSQKHVNCVIPQQLARECLQTVVAYNYCKNCAHVCAMI